MPGAARETESGVYLGIKGLACQRFLCFKGCGELSVSPRVSGISYKPMAPPSLDDLRRRIDRLDDELQDALIERAATGRRNRLGQAIRRHAGAAAGPRGPDPAPAGGAPSWPVPARDAGADLARDAVGHRRDANRARCRGLCPRQRRGIVGPRARPLRQPHSDDGVSHGGRGGRRGQRRPRHAGRGADAGAGRDRAVVAAPAAAARRPSRASSRASLSAPPAMPATRAATRW